MSIRMDRISEKSVVGKKEPVIMGIINVNDQSFFTQSRCTDISSFADQLLKMSAQGAGIIDIGACSTRPGSTPVTLEQEWEYLKEPLMHIRRMREVAQISSDVQTANLPVKLPQISIDTFRSEIVRRAYDIIGEFIVNDISAGEDDPQMLATVGELGLEYIAMHKRGTPSTMQQMCEYPRGVVKEVAEYFIEFHKKAEAAGIRNWIIDPGFGFAKTIEQNYELFSGMPELMSLIAGSASVADSVSEPSEPCPGALGCGTSGRRLLVGISRKSMIYKMLDITPEESLTATAALNLQALMLGADILRVHDVKEAVECVKLYKML